MHGEAGFVKELRRLCASSASIPREHLSISGYWRLGHDEDGWQAVQARVERSRSRREQESATAPAS